MNDRSITERTGPPPFKYGVQPVVVEHHYPTRARCVLSAGFLSAGIGFAGLLASMVVDPPFRWGFVMPLSTGFFYCGLFSFTVLRQEHPKPAKGDILKFSGAVVGFLVVLNVAPAWFIPWWEGLAVMTILRMTLLGFWRMWQRCDDDSEASMANYRVLQRKTLRGTLGIAAAMVAIAAMLFFKRWHMT